jgi:hypothetical protein
LDPSIGATRSASKASRCARENAALSVPAITPGTSAAPSRVRALALTIDQKRLERTTNQL